MAAKTDPKKADPGLNRAFSVFSNTPTTRADLNSIQGTGVAERSLEEFGRGRLIERQREF